MPRPLESEKATLHGLPPLTKAPAAAAAARPDDLHPLVQTLNPSYADSCLALEHATFPEGQRGSREKFVYRLSVCGELCLGLFTTSGEPEPHVATAGTAHIVETAAPERKELLLAMICATKTRNTLVADDDMNVPPAWRDEPHDPSTSVGHQEDGRTIAIHSLAVAPEYQRRRLGRTLLKAYVQRMQTSGVADRISILTYERLVPFYEAVGFEDRGPSKAQYGGGGWVDMVLEFAKDSQVPQDGAD